jgi:hypothetical protein
MPQQPELNFFDESPTRNHIQYPKTMTDLPSSSPMARKELGPSSGYLTYAMVGIPGGIGLAVLYFIQGGCFRKDVLAFFMLGLLRCFIPCFIFYQAGSVVQRWT